MTTENRARILVVDDEAQIRKFLRISLLAHGYDVTEAARGEDALHKLTEDGADLVVLDLGLPTLDGQTVIRRIREWSNVPILVLSVRSDETDKVEALDHGANDYVTKPFGIAELVARLRVLLRNRVGQADPLSYDGAGLRVDFAARKVAVDGEEVHLTRKEYELLRLLTRETGKVLTHETLLRATWGDAYVGETHYLRVHIGRLRQKLGDDPASPRFIFTEPGVGYRLIG